MGARWRGEGGERGRGTAVRYGGPGGLGGAGIGGVRWAKGLAEEAREEGLGEGQFSKRRVQ